MNSLIFSSSASQLYASVYGYNRGIDAPQQLQMSPEGELLVSGKVTVEDGVRITNDTLNVQIAGSRFLSDAAEVGGKEGIVFDGTDVSQLQTATIFIHNTGAVDVCVTLQISPDCKTYFDDPGFTDIAVAKGCKAVIPIGIYAHCVRLRYTAHDDANIAVYFNGRA